MSISANSSVIKPAGLGLRILALVIDAIIVGALAYVLSDFLESMVDLEGGKSNFSYYRYRTVLDVFPVYIAAYVAYNWVGEQSSWQGSPAKRLVGLKVIRVNNNKKIHALQVIGRILGKVLWLVMPPIVFAALNSITNLSEVVTFLIMLVIWILLFIIWSFEKKKRTFYDFFTKTEVVFR